MKINDSKLFKDFLEGKVEVRLVVQQGTGNVLVISTENIPLVIFDNQEEYDSVTKDYPDIKIFKEDQTILSKKASELLKSDISQIELTLFGNNYSFDFDIDKVYFSEISTGKMYDLQNFINYPLIDIVERICGPFESCDIEVTRIWR